MSGGPTGREADTRPGWHRPLAQSAEDLLALHQMCREGRPYDLERWIAEGNPLQLAPEAIRKGTRPKTALQIALETGQHSLTSLLLKSGYRLELERYAPLDLALQSRRWDLFDLLLEWGGNLKSVDVYTVLDTYKVELYERFRAAGYDLTERHEMGAILGHGTRNRPLQRLGPDPARDDFDALYRYAKSDSIVAFLATMQPPKDLTSISRGICGGWMIDSPG